VSPRVQAEELVRSFELFGSRVRILVGVPRSPACATPELAAWALERKFREIHCALTRFDPESELVRLNRSPEATVPVSRDMSRFLKAAKRAASLSEGLVDATCVDALERAGYRESLWGQDPACLSAALVHAPQRRPAAARERSPWQDVSLNIDGTVTRPLGLRFDSGGIAKGVAADIGAAALERYSSFAVDCGGDLRIGGDDRLSRTVEIHDPFGHGAVVRFSITEGAIATTGLNRRIWSVGDGFAHHLINPATGTPAWTGLIQTTAVAPSAVEAEALAKAALLSGPGDAGRWLTRWGGVTFADDGTLEAFGAIRDELESMEAAA
jgi:thiamine biosynthesis lipoprotein